jgi:hypothetical protein
MIAVDKPARLNEEWGMILPPTREICFNASICHNDGLIANSIARREQISYASACVLMERGIEEMKRRLESEGEISIGNIGTIRIGDEGKLSYTPAYSPIRHSERIGFNAISLPKQTQRNIEVEENKTEDAYYRFAISKKAIRVAASIIVMLTVALSVFLPLKSNTATSDLASILPVDKIEKSVSKEDKQVENSINLNNTNELTPEINDDIEIYHLIVATLNTEEQVAQFMAEHQSSPFTLEVLPSKKVTRISIKSSNSIETLNELMGSDSFKREFSSAWILKQ